MSRRIKVYTASKLQYASLWRELDQDDSWREVMEIVARWPFCHVDNIPDHESFAGIFWLQDDQDVRACDIVLVYSQPEDKLRGALVEAGMAIALNKPVMVIGSHPDYGTWQYHPQVFRVRDLNDAQIFLRCMGAER